MFDEDQTAQTLTNLGAALKQHRPLRDSVLESIAASPQGMPYQIPWYRTRPAKALLALAACITLLAAIIKLGGDGAEKAFAAAAARLQNARTFSCRTVYEYTDHGVKKSHEMTLMFKEPNLQRIEHGPGGLNPGETMINDYSQHRRLCLNSTAKTAELENTASHYEVQDSTGAIIPEQLHTDTREDVLRLTAAAVKDLGKTQLDGKTVRVLQSQGGEPIKTVYIDQQTGWPVQLVISRPSAGWTHTYQSIQIDAGLDDALFSLNTPQGYTLIDHTAPRTGSDYTFKMTTKMKYAMTLCFEYANDHNDQFPEALSDLNDKYISVQALATLLAAPDTPDGAPVIVYRKPRAGFQTSKEISLYEIPEQRRDGKVVVGMADSHAEVMSQARFDELIK